MISVITFLLGLTWGLALGVYFYAKVLQKRADKEKVIADPLTAVLERFGASGDKLEGDFIRLNPFTEKLRDSSGDVKLGDLIE